MLITARKIDDFKTARKDLLPPLPLLYRLVPILFYLSLLFAAIVGSAAFWHAHVAKQRQLSLFGQTASLQREVQVTKTKRSALDEQIHEASNLERWVLASMPVQPLIVAIIRSIDKNSTLVDLSIDRDPETPSRLQLSITVRTSDADGQMEITRKAIEDLDYRVLSPTKSMNQGNLEYRATLLREPKSRMPTPEERSKEIRPT